MSAIFGLIHLDGQPVILEELQAMKGCLAPYGPDASGIWTEDSVGLGQCLMRFTPEDMYEQQPLKHTRAKFILVCDARIDNRSELCDKLNISMKESRQMPDSAFIMQAYDKWGIKCTLHLTGPFAFALWDDEKKLLMLARSPMGERPLHYHTSGRTIAFATLPKGLFELSYVKRILNKEYVADYLVNTLPDQGSTFYEDINRLPAGSCLIVTSAGPSLHQYWQPELSTELSLSNDEEYVEAFSALFNRVVSDHLRNSFNTGAMMSGGYDSTTVAAIATNHLELRGQRLTTYTEVPRSGFDGIIVDGRYADETPFVRAMADMYNCIDPHFIRSDGRFYLDNVTSFFTAADIPFRNASNRPWYEAIISQARKDNARVLLTGSFGNLTISWDGRGFLPQLVRKGQLVRAWQEVGSGSPLLRLRRILGSGCLPLLPDFLWNTIQSVRQPSKHSLHNKTPWHYYSPIQHKFATQQRVIERAKDKGWSLLARARHDTRKSRLNTLIMRDCYNGSNYTCAFARNFGVDLRDPTGDQRIFEFCLSLPERQYMCNGKSRWLLQRAMADHLPAVILNNQQRGLQAAGWFEDLCAANPFIQSELARLQQSPLASEILDIHRMQKLFDTITSIPRHHSNAQKIMRDYRQILESGLITGRFLRWVEAGV